jgi:hypothetical protein
MTNVFCLACIWQSINLFSFEIIAQDVKDKSPTTSASTGDPVSNIELNYDKRKLRNHWPYLAEGNGGMGVLLGEKEAMATRILGQSTRRSFDTFDEMYFERRTFSGVVYVYKGLVTRLRYYVHENQVESLKWKTATGLSQEMIENMTEEDAKKFILEFYKNSKYLLRPGSLVIYSKGIGFYWNGNKLRYIDIFEAWRLPR